MKKIVFLVIAITLLWTTASCAHDPKHSLEKTEYYDAYAIMNASVPLYYNSKLIDSPREQYDTVYLVEIKVFGSVTEPKSHSCFFRIIRICKFQVGLTPSDYLRGRV